MLANLLNLMNAFHVFECMVQFRIDLEHQFISIIAELKMCNNQHVLSDRRATCEMRGQIQLAMRVRRVAYSRLTTVHAHCTRVIRTGNAQRSCSHRSIYSTRSARTPRKHSTVVNRWPLLIDSSYCCRECSKLIPMQKSQNVVLGKAGELLRLRSAHM